MQAGKDRIMIFAMAVILASSVIELSEAKKATDWRCQLPIKHATSMCGNNAPEKKWGYDLSENKCFEYWYSKCESNQNVFTKAGKCLEVCKPKSQCLKDPEPPKLPSFLHFSKSWYFNASATECQMRQVTIATASKEKNRFKSKDKCINACMPSYIKEVRSYVEQ
uniref:Pancreatic trypsin inhibitor n=1 Tax=Rhipicephalus zambeziensis TaxID=60191 RepID=A0A224YCL0_9ACAR